MCDLRAVQKSAVCRSRRELSNAHLLANSGVDASENEPYKNVLDPSRCSSVCGERVHRTSAMRSPHSSATKASLPCESLALASNHRSTTSPACSGAETSPNQDSRDRIIQSTSEFFRRSDHLSQSGLRSFFSRDLHNAKECIV